MIGVSKNSDNITSTLGVRSGTTRHGLLVLIRVVYSSARTEALVAYAVARNLA